MNWPSITHYLVQEQPLSFWNYEWRKHGTCTWLNKEPYFLQTLDI
ncbi:Intracellular ribonuclease LX [Bienertia sinuspersici]